MRVLVLCEDYYHPARIARAGLAPLDGQGFEFDFVENTADWPSEMMADYPVVLLTKSNNISATDQTPWMSRDIEDAFVSYVRDGNGLLVLHSGSAGYRETAELRRLTGGAFASHPAQCPVTVEPLEGHALTSGSTPFTVFDEHYMMDQDDRDADVFLTTRSEHGTQPGGWTRREGNGRVCVLTPGHNLDVWLAPSYQRLIANALRWCGKVEST
jgi:type 1 glutamine amidotransferase